MRVRRILQKATNAETSGLVPLCSRGLQPAFNSFEQTRAKARDY